MTAAPSSFQREALTAARFVGWRRVAELRRDLASVPALGGVYVVFNEGEPPKVLEHNGGGRIKGRDPSVLRAVLEARLRVESRVLYIGKGDILRRRIDQLLRFAAGEPVGHWGGRYLWQLADAASFLIAWQVDPEALVAEKRLLDRFVAEFGSLPFANLRF